MSDKKSKKAGNKKSQANPHAELLQKIKYYDELINNSNVKAYLLTIRRGEGTLDNDGFRTIVGYSKFSDFSHHPNVYVKKYNSTAAGAFQITYATWRDAVKNLKLLDFDPHNQTLATIDLIRSQGALNDLLQGNIKSAIRKTHGRWPSLPESGHKTQWNMREALEFYQDQGGKLDESNTNYIDSIKSKISIFKLKKQPVDNSKQYPFIPDYINILMGKPGEIDAKKPEASKKNTPSAPGKMNEISGVLNIGTLGVSNVVTDTANKWNNRVEGFNYPVNPGNLLHSVYNEKSDTAEPVDPGYLIVENASIKIQDFHDRMGQKKHSNNPLSDFFPPQEATPQVHFQVDKIKNGGKHDFINAGFDYAKRNLDILKLDNGYNGVDSEENSNSSSKNGPAGMHLTSRNQPDHHQKSSLRKGLQPTTIVNLNKPLIENFIIQVKDAKEGLHDFKRKVEEVLLEILNSANVIR